MYKNINLSPKVLKHTVTEYIVLSFTLPFIAIQIAYCMICYTGDLCSRLEKKTVHNPNCFIALKFIIILDNMGFYSGV